MSQRLTLLFVCDHPELYTAFVSALISAGFQLLMAHNLQRAKKFLAQLNVDQIMVSHDGHGEGSALAEQLKRMAPQTPILLLAQHGELPPGSRPVCFADFQDEVVARAVATFFRQSLTGSRLTGAGRKVRSETSGKETGISRKPRPKGLRSAFAWVPLPGSPGN